MCGYDKMSSQKTIKWDPITQEQDGRVKKGPKNGVPPEKSGAKTV